MKTPVNSMVFSQYFLKMLAGFGFQDKEIS
jgi:hypothetical protein